MKARIAIVVPRCHERLVGGAEALAWQYAQLLSNVLTLTTRSTMRGSSSALATNNLKGTTIRRFRVERGRTPYFHSLHQNMLDAFARSASSPARQRYCWPEALEEEFIRAQGPNCPGLSTHLATHGDEYAAVFFLPYLYPMTLDGIRAMEHRRWAMVPALHDEPPAYLKTFAHLARRAPRVLWNTIAEQRLGARIWGVDGGNVVAMTVSTDLEAPAREPKPYLLYCGRIDVSKGCAELLEGFEAYKAAHPESPLQLVLTGNDVLGVGKRKDVRYLGFVEEQRKFELMAGALAFVQPSPYESLSIVLLEAMAQRTPVIVNGQCEVLVDHVVESGSGLVYRGTEQLGRAIEQVEALGDAERHASGANARDYVLANYSRDQIRKRLDAEVAALALL